MALRRNRCDDPDVSHRRCSRTSPGRRTLVIAHHIVAQIATPDAEGRPLVLRCNALLRMREGLEITPSAGRNGIRSSADEEGSPEPAGRHDSMTSRVLVGRFRDQLNADELEGGDRQLVTGVSDQRQLHHCSDRP